MKKRRFICFLIVTMFILGFLISDVAFGQSSKLIDHPTYKQTLLREKVRSLLPDFLKVFNGSERQKKMVPRHVNTFLNNPLFLRRSVPGTDDEFIGLLYVDKDFRTLFGADPFYTVLKSSREIDTLLKWFEALPPLPEGPGSQKATTPKATTLSMVSGNKQSGETGELLARPFVVGVLDQEGKPLQRIQVTFEITEGNRLLSATRETTNVSGDARTTLTLGSDPGTYLVKASVAAKDSLNGVELTQTFTATATAPPEPEPEPVVSVQPSTAEPSLPPMYWIGDNRIHYRLPGGREETFVPEDGTLTGGLAVDTIGGKVYWTERTISNKGRIRSADLDGTNPQTVKKIIAVPFDLAFDAVNGKLYWTNDQTNNRTNDSGKIHSINVNDDESFNPRFITDLNSPKHIAFDVEKRRLYWTDARGIWSTFPESAGRGNIPFLGNLGEVRDIAVFNDVVYWTEQTLVRYRNGTGFGDKKLLPTPEGSIPEGIAVDPVGKRVYWTTSDGEIRSAPLTNPTQFVVERSVGPATGIALGGIAGMSSSSVASAPSVSSVDSVGSVENTLLANYPNPFNPETWIPYQLSASADVSVSIYAVDGRLVRRLDLGHQVEGVYRSRSRAAYWDGRNEFGERVASGLYFYTLTAGDFTATRKMLIRK